MLLGATFGAMAVGEIQLIFELLPKLNYQLKCSCGKKVTECPFWAPALERFRALLPGMSLERAAEITRTVESLPERTHATDADREEYRQLWNAIFRAIADESGAAVLVDSSKTGRGALYRPRSLALAGFDVRLLHVVRDPRAVAWSILRREIASGRLIGARAEFAAAAYTGLHWSATNVSTSAMYGGGQGVNYLALRFESFEDQPVETLRQIGGVFDLDVTRAVEIVQNGEIIPNGHLSSGNEVRYQKEARLTAQPPTWKTRLSRPAKVGITLSTPAAYLYHYAVANWR
jgi:hypothetical protein